MDGAMSVVFYSEINLFCVLLLAIVLAMALRSADRRRMGGLFFVTVSALIAFLLCDLAWGLVDNGYLQVPLPVNYALNVTYFSLGSLASFLWFIYSERAQGSPLLRGRLRPALCALPLALLVALTLVSTRTGFLFRLDEAGRYHRGPGYPLHLLLSYGYIFFTSGRAFVKALRRDNYVLRGEYLTLASFAAPPLVFGCLQVLFPGIPMLCMGLTVSVLLVYMRSQELLISLDPLTRMNNRSQLTRYLAGRMRRTDESRRLFLLIMDIDNFKEINDKYGHVEGDNALILTADALKTVCGISGCFGARYGGDEFVLVYEGLDRRSVDALCRQIQGTLADLCARAEKPYALSLSIGWTEHDGRSAYIPDLIAAADRELYAAKQARR